MIPCSPKRFKNYNYMQHPYYISYRRHIESTKLSFQILTFFEILQYELQGSHPHTNKQIHCQHCSPELISAFRQLSIEEKLLFMNKIAQGLTVEKSAIKQIRQSVNRIVCNQKKSFLGFPFYETVILQFNGNSQLILERKTQATIDLRKYLVKGLNNIGQITLIQVARKKQLITFQFNSQKQHKSVYQQIKKIIFAHCVEKINKKENISVVKLKSISSDSQKINKMLTSSNLAKFNQKKKMYETIFRDQKIRYILMAKNHNYKILVNQNNKAQFKAIVQIPGISSEYLLGYQNRFSLLTSKQILQKEQQYQLNAISLKINSLIMKQTVLKECIKNRLGISIFQQSLNFSQTFQCLLQFLEIEVEIGKCELTINAIFNIRFQSYLELAISYLNQLCKAFLPNQKFIIKYPDQYEDYFTIIGEQDDMQSIYKNFDEQERQMPLKKTPPTSSASSSQIDKKSVDKYQDKKDILSIERYRIKPQQIVVPRKIQMKDHRIFSEWKRKKGGGLVFYRKQKLEGQSKYIMQMIKEYGKKLLEIQNFRNFSLHVGLMAKQSHLTTMCHSQNYCPMLIQPSVNKQPIEKMKAVLKFQLSSGLMGICFAKPFNPILGETYQAWINGCPYYSEQISHHPPIVSFYFVGRGFKFYGQVQPQAKLNMNGVLAFNKKISYIQYQDGDIISFNFGFFTIRGLVWGDRQIQYYEPTFAFDKKNKLFAKTSHGPRYKSFFSSTNDRQDYFHGSIYKVSDSFCKNFQQNISTLNVVYPNKADIIETLSNYEGEWNNHITFDGIRVLDFTKDLPDIIVEQENPLPSNSWFRQDLHSLIQNNINEAQKNKKILQQKQREDRKLRENYKKQTK